MTKKKTYALSAEEFSLYQAMLTDYGELYAQCKHCLEYTHQMYICRHCGKDPDE